MSRIAVFTTADGDEVAVQVADDAAGGVTFRGGGSGALVERTQQNLDEVLAHARPAVVSLLRQLRDVEDAPDELEVEFGIQVAQPERRVVAVLGDGSAMYSIQALWTAANLMLPLVFVIANNGGYRILKQRLKLFHDNDRFIGMDFKDPPIDIAGLARSFGVSASSCSTHSSTVPIMALSMVDSDHDA